MNLTRKQFWINFFAASVGNLFEHYDKALFAFLAPTLAPLFFEEKSTLTALILTYAIMPIGLFSRPFSALIFGWIGDRKGRSIALNTSLIGMAITTLMMGYIPIYSQVGWCAPIFLALGRLTQNFFASGEATGGALLILEACEEKKRSLFNGFYECSTILGILLASLGVTVLSIKGSIVSHWRILYWIGGATGGFCLIIRLFTTEAPIKPKPKQRILPYLWKHRIPFLIVTITSGFSYANYYMVTSLLNGYLPLVSSISKGEAIQVNSFILVFDFILLPLGGLLGMHYSKEKLMIIFASLICIVAIPLYSLIPIVSLFTTVFIRMVFVILGVGFSVILAPYYQDLISHENRYTIICLGNAIGSQLFGTSACSIGFFIYKYTGWIASPALYLIATGLIAITTIHFSRNRVVVKSA